MRKTPVKKNKGNVFLFMLCIALLAGINATAYAACETEGKFPYSDPFGIEECPVELDRWMERLNACAEHEQAFADLSMSDEEMEKHEWAMIDLDCCKVSCDYYDLKEKYADNASYIGVLEGYMEHVHEDTQPECIKPGSELEKKYGLDMSAPVGERPAYIPETKLPE